MNQLIKTFSTSIGKKTLMAVTGLSFCLFLMVHLAGNLTVYCGEETLNSYVEHLHSLGVILKIAECGLIAFAAIHILTGLLLFFQNFKARPMRYEMDKKAGGSTLGSSTMPYSGIIILSFVLIHLVGFYIAHTTNRTIFGTLEYIFSNPAFVLIYVFAVMTIFIHVKHGFWSAFQTLGANHPKYNFAIKSLSIILSLLVLIGFGFIPIYFSLII